MTNADTLSFQEFVMSEPLPLATIQEAVLEFLRGRDDVVLFGAQAVNAYVGEPRMAQDIGLLSIHAQELAEELRQYLSQRFRIAVRLRQVADGRGFRLFQVRKAGNRHLVDIRDVDTLPMFQHIAQVQVIAPAALVASKVISYHQRRGRPKSGTDWRDLAMLLLTFPELKQASGAVLENLEAAGVGQAVREVWDELVAQEIHAEDEDDEFQ